MTTQSLSWVMTLAVNGTHSLSTKFNVVLLMIRSMKHTQLVRLNDKLFPGSFLESVTWLSNSSIFYHMMSWKWKMDQSNVSIQVTCQVVVDWQRPAKSNYDLLLSSTSKFNWMHYLNDVKLFLIYQMIYICDENEKIYMKIYSEWFKFIVMIWHNGTPNNGSSFYFVLVTLFTMQTTTIIFMSL